MIRYLLCLLVLTMFSRLSFSQNNYNNQWMIWTGRQVSFSTGNIQNFLPPNMPTIPANFRNTQAVDHARTAISDRNTGALLFNVAIPLLVANNNSMMYCFYNKTGHPMPNGQCFMSSYLINNGQPVIVPNPIDSQVYHVFTALNNGLQYSTIDMRLDIGKGDIVSNKKMIPLMPNGTITGQKLTPIPGCNSVWLVAKLAYENGFVSFKIDHNGVVHTTPVYSYTGTLPTRAYIDTRLAPSTMKASPNGELLAVTTRNGTELYDVERCSGKIKNPRLIDTTMSFGACFSPDNKLLYTNRAEYVTGYYQSSEIVQWDVTHPQNLASIQASAQIIMINSAYHWPDWGQDISSYMGDIAQGKDGKLYTLSNTMYVYLPWQYPIPLPPTTIVPEAQTMHIIHQPNQQGMACQPERDAFYLEGRYLDRAGCFLPHPIYDIPNNPLDTVYNAPHHRIMCFGNGLSLGIDSTVSCIQWYNGSAEPGIFTKDTGRLWVTYARDCQWFVDTFHVVDISLPQIPPFILTCPYERELFVTVSDRNAHPYTYTLTKEDSLINQVTTKGNYILNGLDTGYYTLRIQSDFCDTSVNITIEDLPVPEVSIDPRVSLLPYGDTLTLEAHGAASYAWLPDQYLYGGNDPSVIVFPRKDSRFIAVGTNEYGCRDTAYGYVKIDHTMKLWLPNAFSPNGDGFNDVFRPEGITYQRLISWSIFNRYGQQVYASSNINEGWDGTYQDKPCDMGVYYYHIRYYNTANEVYTHKGEVHLMK